LISYKFDRDQERQADEAGFRYMVEAGFSPLGAVRLAETMQRNGAGGIGLFFDNHPGWPERTARFQALIKASPQAQAAVARIGARTELATTSAAASQTQVALSPAYQATDAEKTFADGIAAFSRRDFQMGVKAIRSSAALGYAPAQRELAYLYGGGLAGLSKDEVEAVRLYRLAAEQSDARALNNLAVMYSQGRGGLPLDDVEALRLYREAATKGDSTALLNLGHLYQDGKGGVQKDVSVAKNYYQQSADAGNGDALAQVGLLYQYGGAGESDIPKAVTLYRESANNGSALGQYRLARCYLDGIGIQKDEVEAAKWLQLAATQGNAEALIVLPEEQPKLGEMYLRGQGGLTKNPMEALRLFQASAAQGNAEGEFWLGSMYELGDAGLPVDKEKAANWYRKAAAQGHAKAAERLSNMGTRP
jgi:TPR repeat protein